LERKEKVCERIEIKEKGCEKGKEKCFVKSNQENSLNSQRL
jgi:hypothetical protein